MLVEQGQHTLCNIKTAYLFNSIHIIRNLIYIYTCKWYYVSNWNCVELQIFILEMKFLCQNWKLCFMFMYIDDILCALFISILVVLVSFIFFWSWCVIGVIRIWFGVLVCLFVKVVYVCYGSFSLSLLELLMSFVCYGFFSLSKILA
jgi:hypothetical protein